MLHRVLSILCVVAPLALAQSGCAGAPNRATLLEGQGVFTLRFNPPGCLAGRPELHVEVKTPQGWERVALEQPPEDEPDLRQQLLSRFEADPYDQVPVEARFTRRVIPAISGHASRVLRLIDLDPPPEPEAPR